jgi:putative DNA primase/helicase
MTIAQTHESYAQADGESIPALLGDGRAGMIEHALMHLKQALPVFPVCSPAAGGRCFEGHPPSSQHGPDDVGKTPLVKWGEYRTRLPTEAEVRRLWRKWPRANIGFATGELSGKVVLDLDGAAAVAEAARLGGIDDGPWVSTGRVGGQHRYCSYRDDEPRDFAKLRGIDYRGEGGYAILPPSRHRNGPTYTWRVPLGALELPELPRWVNDLKAEGRGQNGTAAAVLGDIPEHQRNTTLLSFGGSMRRRGMSQKAIEAALLIENADRCKPPLEETEVLKIAASVSRYTPTVSDGVLLPPVLKVQVG